MCAKSFCLELIAGTQVQSNVNSSNDFTNFIPKMLCCGGCWFPVSPGGGTGYHAVRTRQDEGERLDVGLGGCVYVTWQAHILHVMFTCFCSRFSKWAHRFAFAFTFNFIRQILTVFSIMQSGMDKFVNMFLFCLYLVREDRWPFVRCSAPRPSGLDRW